MSSYAILINYRNKLTVLDTYTTLEIYEEQEKQISKKREQSSLACLLT